MPSHIDIYDDIICVMKFNWQTATTLRPLQLWKRGNGGEGVILVANGEGKRRVLLNFHWSNRVIRNKY